jgi:hypothetical protein
MKLFQDAVATDTIYKALELLSVGIKTSILSTTQAHSLLSPVQTTVRILSKVLADNNWRLASSILRGYAGISNSYVTSGVLAAVGSTQYSRVFAETADRIVAQDAGLAPTLVYMAKLLEPSGSGQFARDAESLRNSRLVPMLIEALKSNDIPKVKWVLDSVASLGLSENKTVLAALNGLWNHTAYEQARDILAVYSGVSLVETFDTVVLE